MNYTPGRNLLKNTQNIQGGNGYLVFSCPKVGALTLGKTYCLSINLYTDDECCSLNPHVDAGNNSIGRAIIPTDTPTTIVKTFTYKMNANETSPTNKDMHFYRSDKTNTGTVYVNWVMLTEGEEEYDYRLAPEDVVLVGGGGYFQRLFGKLILQLRKCLISLFSEVY